MTRRDKQQKRIKNNTNREQATYLAQQREQIGHHHQHQSKQPRDLIVPQHNTSGDIIFWQTLRRRWQRLSTAEKAMWVVMGLVAAGLTVVTIYYIAPSIIQSFDADHEICPGFKRQGGGNPKHASVVLLGEAHTHRDETAHCIDKISHNNGLPEIVLVEQVPRGMVIPCREKGITDQVGRTCMGWDSREAVEERYSNTLDETQNESVELLVGPNSPLSETELTTLIHQQIPKLSKQLGQMPARLIRKDEEDDQRREFTEEENKYLQYRRQQQILQQIGKMLVNGIPKAQIYKELKKSLKPYLNDYIPSFSDPDLVASMHHRQHSLIEAIREASMDKQQRVIAVAGAAHFFSYHEKAGHVIEKSIRDIEEQFKDDVSGLITTRLTPAN